MRIETDRCLIRGFEEQDIDDFMAYRNNKKWMRYQGFKGLTRQEYMQALLGKSNMLEGVQLAIIEKALGRLIGDIYIKSEDNAYWLGYTVNPSYARQGYTFEAVGGIISWLKENGADRVLADTLPENTASINLLKKLGFAALGRDSKGAELFALDLK